MRAEVQRVAEELVNDILTPLIDEGRTPKWATPWEGILGPTSVATGNGYKGRNRVMLMFYGSHYEAPLWMTYGRARALSIAYAKERGEVHAHGVRKCRVDGCGCVKSADNSVEGVYYGIQAEMTGQVIFKPYTRRFKKTKDAGTADERDEISTWTEFTLDKVFNVAQTALPAEWVKEKMSLPEQPNVCDGTVFDDMLDLVREVMPELTVEVKEQPQAFYSPMRDLMQVPPASAYTSEQRMSEVLIHEAIHATGAAKRLARPGVTANPMKRTPLAYAIEEVIAELGASLYCTMVGIDHDAAQHAEYIQGWAKAVHDAENATAVMLRVLTDATKAVEWLMHGPLEDTPEGGRAASA